MSIIEIVEDVVRDDVFTLNNSLNTLAQYGEVKGILIDVDKQQSSFSANTFGFYVLVAGRKSDQIGQLPYSLSRHTVERNYKESIYVKGYDKKALKEYSRPINYAFVSEELDVRISHQAADRIRMHIDNARNGLTIIGR